uniref:WD repeat-containing protein 75 second beta-propeller domain-containing protein n=1 Tax=Clastoptera arizonana TaxID=38151 RepID=A0A1B6EFG8_9HEMI
MVILKENHQIIEKSMNENIIIHRKEGGSLIKRKPVFSPDGKYVYLLCQWCVNAFSTLTGEFIRQYVPQNMKNDKLVGLAVEENFVFSLSSKGYLTKWRYNAVMPLSTIKLKKQKSREISDLGLLKYNAKTSEYDCYVYEKEENKCFVNIVVYNISSGEFIKNLYVSADDSPHSISFGKVGSEYYVGTIKQTRATVIFLKKSSKNYSFLAGNNRIWTAVGCHPEQCIIAFGDNTGRIVVWTHSADSARESCPKAIFHWHTLPVRHVEFSATGSYLYSGGGEGVMVRWNVESPNIRNFLPRLPAPVEHISLSNDNQIIAISTSDNGIQLVDAQNRLFCVIQNLTWGICVVKGSTLFPVGLTWDPLTKCLVLNGRPGHLQFYNPQYKKLLYNLDITGQNYLSQERNKEIINTDVTHAQLSGDGKWMVTVETRNDKETSIEVWLKFWQYKFNARQFSLNTCVELPHYGPVNCVRFQPILPSQTEKHISDYVVVTTGNDKKFRLWTSVESVSIHKDGVKWGCESVGFYREQLAGAVSFSSDGSLLGVIFGPTLTIWDVDTNQMNATLTRDNNNLRFVEFGKKNCSHLVVTTNESNLYVWNILTLTVLWNVPLQVDILFADPNSSNMAIFTDSNKLFVFTPSSPDPLYEHINVCKDGVKPLAGIFIPRTKLLNHTTTPWLENSQLYFIDSNQELLFVDLEREGEDEKAVANVMESDTPTTPFSILVAKETVSSVEEKNNTNMHTQFGVLGGDTVKQLLTAPAHTIPHISSLCESFLKSLVIKKNMGKKELKEEQETLPTFTEGDSSSDSEAPHTTVKSPAPDKKKKRRRQRKSSTRNSFSFEENSTWPLSDVFAE